MEEKVMAYVAGLIDGDGSISLCKKHERDAKSVLFIPMIQFSQSSPSVPAFLKSLFGGSIFNVDRTNTHRKKVEYKWKLSNVAVRDCLLNICKHLQNKKEQAEELIRYIEKNPFIRGKRIEEDVLIDREQSYCKIKSLNAGRDTMSRLKTNQPKRNDELFWPYFAGLLDTDGSFSIKKERSRGHSYTPCILLSSVNSNSINYIGKNCIYGTIFMVKAPQLKQKFYYRFGAYTRNDVANIITNVLPYLRNKKESAQCLLDFCEGFVAQQGRYKKTLDQQKFREDLYEKIIDANNGLSKSSLIVLEPLPDHAGGNKEQAGQKPCSLNAVSGMTSKEDAVL